MKPIAVKCLISPLCMALSILFNLDFPACPLMMASTLPCFSNCSQITVSLKTNLNQFFITHVGPLSIVFINGSLISCQLLLENNSTTLFLWVINSNLGDVYNIAWSGHQSNWLLAGETNPPNICSPQIKSVIEFHFLAEAQLPFDQNLFLSQALLLDL